MAGAIGKRDHRARRGFTARADAATLRTLFQEDSPFIACDPNSGCWLWTSNLSGDGYGRVPMGRRGLVAYAHRLSLELHGGWLEPGAEACHKCDTPACVNPRHLFAGTHADNMRDAHAKGRLNDPNRERSTPELVIAEIKAALSAGVQGRVVAADYGISEATVSAIKNGRRWTRIESLKQPSPARKAPPQPAPREREGV